jgi:hypothetical protein
MQEREVVRVQLLDRHIGKGDGVLCVDGYHRVGPHLMGCSDDVVEVVERAVLELNDILLGKIRDHVLAEVRAKYECVGPFAAEQNVVACANGANFVVPAPPPPPELAATTAARSNSYPSASNSPA